MNSTHRLLATLLVLMAGLACRQKADPEGALPAHPSHEQETSGAEGKTETWYQCAMHPQILRNAPGTCPICGMDLVPVAKERSRDVGNSDVTSLPAVRLSPNKIRAIGVRTEAAERRALQSELRLNGTVAFDPGRVTTLISRVAGYAEEVTSKIPGDPVRGGEVLARIYSPEWAATQEEWLQARQYRAALGADPDGRQVGFADSLILSTRRRLINLGLPEAAVEALEKTGRPSRQLPIQSPDAGVLLERRLESGQALQAGEVLFRVADMSKVYAVGQASQSDLPGIRVGMPAQVELPALGGERFTGTVASLSPTLNAETRTGEVRVLVENSGDRPLRPEMLVVIHLRADAGAESPALSVPEQSVIRSGLRNIVLVEEEPGFFRPREVQLGRSAEGRVEVLSGLREGEAVVTTSQFLIDAESNLRAAVDAMQNQDGPKP